MSKSKKEIIDSLEKVLKELKKKENKPKTTDEYLKEISEKLSKLLEKNDMDKYKDPCSVIYPRYLVNDERLTPVALWEQTFCESKNDIMTFKKPSNYSEVRYITRHKY